jgi:DNA-binding PadR family transcriptional regulator
MVRGYLSAIVLNVLERGDSYGYQVTKDVNTRSHGAYTINEATLYTVFKRLEKAGSITGYWGDESQGGRRKYYQITDAGRKQLASERATWDLAKQTLEALINGNN